MTFYTAWSQMGNVGGQMLYMMIRLEKMIQLEKVIL